MRLTLIIYSLSSGGAERVMSNMANYWAEKGLDITLITLEKIKAPFYELNPRIKLKSLDIGQPSSNPLQGFLSNLNRLWVIRKAIRKSQPEAVISFMTRANVLVLLATVLLKIPVLVCEQVFPSFSVDSKIWKILRSLVYHRASRLIVLSESSLACFSSFVQRRTVIIPNPVFIPENGHHPNSETPVQPNGKTLMAMGRLAHQKGFDLLLQAFAKIADKHPDWSLKIWGEGELRPPLETQRDNLGLQDRVSLPGLTKDPYKEMKQADLFVMSSRFEGFPVVLVEAMACGLPVISYDCPSGPRDAIQNGINGLLVPPENIDELARALDDLMQNEEKRKDFANRAPEVKEQFGLEKVMGLWNSCLDGVKS